MVESGRATVLRQMADIRRVHGRTAELACLSAALDEVASGVARVVVLEGPPGIGKTTLLDILGDAARDRGVAVRVGRADEVGRRPFGPLVEALGDRLEVLPTAVRDDSAGGDPPDDVRYRAIDTLVAAVEGLAANGGVVLVVDDVQWADPSTVLALRAISRWVADRPLLMALAVRPQPSGPELSRLLAALVDDGATVVTVGPLDDDAVTAMATEALRQRPDDAVRAGLARAGGNPLYLRELLRHDPTGPAPASLARLVARGLQDLTEDHRMLLQDAAVLGGGVRIGELAAVADVDLATVARAGDALVAAGVLVVDDDGEGLRFGHDVVRRAILDEPSGPARAALHERAAWRLAAHGAPARRVADQLVRSRPRPGDRRAVDWLRRAAAEQRAAAPAVAADLLAVAVELVSPGDDLRALVLAERVEALVAAGAVETAIAEADDALVTVPTPSVRERLVVARVEALTAAGDLDGVLTGVAVELGRGGLSPATIALLQALAANAHDVMGDEAQADAAAVQAIESAGEDASASRARAMATLVRADVARLRGRTAEALALAEAVRAEEDRHGARSPWPPEVFVGLVLHEADRLEEAERAVRAGLLRGERWGRMAYQPALHTIAAEVLVAMGRWDDALAEARTAMTLADDVELRLLTDWTRGVAGELLVRRGELEEAEQVLVRLASGAPSGRPVVALARALLLEATGADDEARRVMAAGWAATEGRLPGARVLAVEAVRLFLVGGDDDAAAGVATAMEAAVGDGDAPAGLRGIASLCRGMVSEDPATLLEAVAVLSRSPRVPDLHIGQAHAGLVLAGRGDGRGAGLLHEAVAGLDALGARREVARALAAAREVGVVVGRPRDQARPSVGVSALTPAERRAAELAASGLTNSEIGARLFVSPRTVQSHLAATYRKLGIRSRVQLAVRLHDGAAEQSSR